MQLKLFVIKDLKANVYLQVMFFRTSAEAIRSFAKAVSDEKSDFFSHAEDYVLYELGSYTDEDAKFNLRDTPQPLISAVDASVQHKEYYASRSLPS